MRVLLFKGVSYCLYICICLCEYADFISWLGKMDDISVVVGLCKRRGKKSSSKLDNG